jgi:hypothetical protein
VLRVGSADELPEGFRRRNARTLGAVDAAPARPSVAKTPSGPAAGRAKTFRPCPHPGCVDGCVEPATLRLFVPGRPLSTNRAVSALFVKDPAVQRARIAEVGRAYQDVKALAYAVVLRDRIPTWARAWLVVHAEYVRGPALDTDGTSLAAKAALDGMTAAGLLVDDDGAHVMGVRLDPPVKAVEDGLVIEASNQPLW